MYGSFGFAEYHRKRTERKEKIKLFCYAVGFALIGLGAVLLCCFIGGLI